MKAKLFLMFLLLSIALSAQAQHRPVTFYTDISRLDYARDALQIFQGDSLTLHIYARHGASAVNLGGGTFALWTISDASASQLWMIATGTVANATAGYVRVTCYPSQTLLPPKQYLSQVRVYGVQAGVTQAIATVLYATTLVMPSADVTASMATNTISPPWTITVNDYSGGANLENLSNGLVSVGATATQALEVATIASNETVKIATVGATATQALEVATIASNETASLKALRDTASAPLVLTALNGTLTIPRTNTRHFAATLSGACTITVAVASFPTSVAFSARLDIIGSNLYSVTFPTSVFLASGYYSSTNAFVATNGVTTLLFDKSFGESFPCRVATF